MFHTPKNSIPNAELAGNLLIANPSLRDDTFNRAIIYLVEHNPLQTSTGFILNNPTGTNVGKLVHTQELTALRHLPVYYGGPCDNDKLMFIQFKWTTGNKLKCKTQINSNQATELIKEPNNLLRAYIGHSGWSKGQLSEELVSNTWFTARPPINLLNQTPDKSLWTHTLAHLSPFHKIISLHPKQPELN